MQSVEFTVDMRPWRKGDRVPLPDAVAAAAVARGEARDARPWPEGATTEVAPAETKPAAPRAGRRPGHSYLTK